MNKLPAVLNARGRNSAISVERALKQVLELLNEIEPQDERQEDRINASIDDVEFMLSCIDRG